MTPIPPKTRKLTERQQRTVARIIGRHVGWMVNWYVDEVDRVKTYEKAARAVARYIARLKP